MCGIVTIYQYNSFPTVDRDELVKIRDRMTSRGPDGFGEWYSSDNRVAMGHRRLAIIDLSESGAQPMSNEDGTIWITFNGEIYNYKELGNRLRALGHRFKSNSDTEVIIHGYEEWGIEDLLKQLRGMFAFAIYDDRSPSHGSRFTSHESRLIIARDPFGIKPLYYADDGKTIRVASQVKALLAGGKIDTSPEPAGHVGFFLWSHVPEPYTLYKGIRSLPAGSYMTVDQNGNRTTGSYCSITQILADAERNPVSLSKEEVHERLRTALLDTVKHHLIADVPVGVFLSSGLDSSTLTALASETAKDRLNTVTLGFREYLGTDNDEVPLAEQVAKDYGTLQRTILVEKKDFRVDFERLFDAMDQPTTDGVNSYFVSKAAARAGLKVAISGLGGDELFGSYPSFRQIPRMVRAFGQLSPLSSAGKAFRAVSAPLLKHFTSPKYAGLFEYGGSYGGAYLLCRGMFMPWELPKLLDGDMVKEGWQELQTLIKLEQTVQGIGNSHLKVAALEMSWYMRNQLLRDTDWASMAHSLEVRVPLVDVNLLHALCPLLSASTVSCGKRDMAMTPLKSLPDEILHREKTGFTVPVREWLMEDIQPAEERGLRGWAKRVYAEHSGEEPFSGVMSAKKAAGAASVQTPSALIFRTGQLGDTLVAMPAIAAVREKYQNYRLILLTDRHPGSSGYVSSWDVLGPTGWFDDVMFYTPAGNPKGTLENMISLTGKLRKLAPKYVFDLSPERTTWQSKRDLFFFQHLVGIPEYCGHGAYRKEGRNVVGTLPHLQPEWMRLLGIVKGEAGNTFSLPIPDNERKIAQDVFESEGISPEKKLLAIGPGSKMPAKRWPKERYAELGKRLMKHFPDSVLLILGGKEDKKLGDELCSEWGKHSYNLAGKLSIYGSAAVLGKCAAYVGNDTGTMHLAAMVGKPCVAIFSSRDYPGKWEPYGANHAILRHETKCAGCMLEVCTENNKCLAMISISDVYSGIESVLTHARVEKTMM
jgi:asparagine synthase (glutamine-hydrolysing)